MIERVYVVANPAAGQGTFDIRELNTQLSAQGVDWEVMFTKKYGDAQLFARQAVKAGADLVAAYGGDGTVSEVASGLLGSNVPLAILPGGTANVMSVELGIPQRFAEACALIQREHLVTRPVDVGQVDDSCFILRMSIGLEAKMVEGADRTLKDRIGTLAYALSALRALQTPEVVHYRFDMDGKRVEEEGIACIIANSGNLGMAGLRLAPTVEIDDGLVDVFLVNNTNLPTLMSLVGSILGQERAPVENEKQEKVAWLSDTVRHWQAREVKIVTNPITRVQCDGEMIGETPKHVQVVPSALHVVTPQDANQIDNGQIDNGIEVEQKK